MRTGLTDEQLFDAMKTLLEGMAAPAAEEAPADAAPAEAPAATEEPPADAPPSE